ncbi:helix-turn-helix transcriptional regulator [bacterium AH-315-K03]|nr:helix-turn-helix transcriptional regulator [bacterium AH-315-K03]
MIKNNAAAKKEGYLQNSLNPLGHFASVKHLLKAGDDLGCGLDIRQLESGGCESFSTFFSSEDITIVHYRFSRQFEIEGALPNDCVTLALSAKSTQWLCNGELFDDSQVLLLYPQTHVYISTQSSDDVTCVHIPLSLWMDTVNDMGFDRRYFDRSAVSVLSLSLDSSHHIRRHINNYIRCCKYNSWHSQNVSKLLLFFVFLFKVSGEARPLLKKRGREKWRVLMRARQYITRHIEEPISMTALGGEIGASVSTIERYFRSGFNMTPTAYILAYRLNRVRSELSQMQSSETSVSDIAMKYGFTHLGRFSAAYRQHFGVLPREVLSAFTSLPS